MVIGFKTTKTRGTWKVHPHILRGTLEISSRIKSFLVTESAHVSCEADLGLGRHRRSDVTPRKADLLLVHIPQVLVQRELSGLPLNFSQRVQASCFMLAPDCCGEDRWPSL